MDINNLKNTNDEQFEKDITFNLPIPDGSGEELKLTIKSVRNKTIKPQFRKLIKESEKERAKFDKANITDEQVAVIDEKVTAIDTSVCKLVFVKFEGLTDGDKPLPSTDKNKEMLVANYEWIRTAIVEKAASMDAFY